MITKTNGYLTDHLTVRELETLALLSQGFNTKYILRKLDISKKTYENYIGNIYLKLSVSSNEIIEPKSTSILFFIKNDLALYKDTFKKAKHKKFSTILDEYFKKASRNTQEYSNLQNKLKG